MVLGSLMAVGSASAADQLAPRFNDSKAKIQANKNIRLTQAPKKNVTRAGDDLEIMEVYSNPQGTPQYYKKNSVGLFWYYDDEQVDAPALFVFGDDNSVYIQDPITSWDTGNFAKGELSDGKITVSLPQTLYYWPNENMGLNMYVMKQSASDPEEYEVDFDITSLEYIVDEDGVITLDLPGEPYEYMLGYVYTSDGGTWDGDGDFYQDYTVADVNTAPAGLAFENYVMKEEGYGYMVGIGADSENLYIKGLFTGVPDGIVIAKLDGNTATISQDQVIGGYWGYWVYTKLFSFHDTNFGLAPANEVYTLNVDLENKTITSAEQDYSLAMNADLEEAKIFTYYDSFEIYVQDSFIGTPSNPYDLEFYDEYLDEYGFYYFGFELPNISTDDLVLLPGNMYYKIYLDEEAYEFEPDNFYYIYYGLDEPTTEIPFLFDNGIDIQVSDAYHMVGIYVEGFTTIGVQAVYRYDGVVRESAIITLNLEDGEVTETPAGVETLLNSQIVNETYYDLSGRKVMNPEKGIFIKRATLSDGNVVTKKVIKK